MQKEIYQIITSLLSDGSPKIFLVGAGISFDRPSNLPPARVFMKGFVDSIADDAEILLENHDLIVMGYSDIDDYNISELLVSIKTNRVKFFQYYCFRPLIKHYEDCII
ncbi:MAG: hypothetical protein CV087_21370 [Candidatus Brocadia sp. WS118]|nr:MAG: hypothetical protein CV087_21370 [Candidatus Brocadia sp. WS118]